MDRPQTPTKSRIEVSDSELLKRAAPGGRVPAGALQPRDHRGGGEWQNISDGSPNAMAGQAERDYRRERPDVAARRAAKGK
jgi:hypothetical protein